MPDALKLDDIERGLVEWLSDFHDCEDGAADDVDAHRAWLRGLREYLRGRAARENTYNEGQRIVRETLERRAGLSPIAPDEKLRYALRECHTLAIREARREQRADPSKSSVWNHIVRFCKDADDDGSMTTLSILRDPVLSPIARTEIERVRDDLARKIRLTARGNGGVLTMDLERWIESLDAVLESTKEAP